MKILKVIYDPDFGAAVPDGQVKDYVSRIISTCHNLREDITISVGCESIIFQFRIAMKEGKVPEDMEILIVWREKEYPIGRDGMFTDDELDGIIGTGFCDLQISQMSKLF